MGTDLDDENDRDWCPGGVVVRNVLVGETHLLPKACRHGQANRRNGRDELAGGELERKRQLRNGCNVYGSCPPLASRQAPHRANPYTRHVLCGKTRWPPDFRHLSFLLPSFIAFTSLLLQRTPPYACTYLNPQIAPMYSPNRVLDNLLTCPLQPSDVTRLFTL